MPSDVDEDKIVGKTPEETIELRAKLKGEEIVKKLQRYKDSKLQKEKKSKAYGLVPSASLSSLSTNAYGLGTKANLIISADSSAILNNEIIGKPKDRKEAEEMLAKLSGKTHKFITAYYIVRTASAGLHPAEASGTGQNKSLKIGEKWEGVDISFVTFRNISEKEIELYLNHFNYTKFAGAYALFTPPLCPAPAPYEDLISGESYAIILNKIRNQYPNFKPLVPDFITGIKGSLSGVIGLPLEKVIPILKENQVL